MTKKRKVYLGILAIALVFGLAVAGCDNLDGISGNSGNGSDDSTNKNDQTNQDDSITNGDDSTDKDNQTNQDGSITIGNWTWVVYNDLYNNGKSTITMTQGTGADSNKLTFSGNITKVDKYDGYIGIRPEPNNTEFAKLKTASSVSFKVKGDGSYVFIARTSDNTDYSDYNKYFVAGTTETTITIDFNDLDTPGWGQSQLNTFNQYNIESIMIQSSGVIGPFNITISDLTLNNDGNDGSGSVVVSSNGDTLTLSGQVYKVSQGIDGDTKLVNYIKHRKITSDTITLSDELSCGSGSIQNGQISYTLGVPNSAKYKSVSTFFSSDEYTNIVISQNDNQNDAKGISLENLENNSNNLYYKPVIRGELSFTTVGNNRIYKTVAVVYLYLDKACTIKTTGKTYTEKGETYTTTTNDMNLILNKGWNVVHVIIEETYNVTTGVKTSKVLRYYNGDYPYSKWFIANL